MTTSISTVVVAATIMGLGAVASAQEACAPQRLTSPLGAQALIYGYDVVTNGTHWFVADSAARTPCATGLCQTGAVHVYDMVEGRLVHTQTIVPPDAQSFQSFGRSIAADGHRLVVGSPLARWPDRTWWPGVVYVYEHDGEQWVETDRIGPPDEVHENFGIFVHLYGDEILVHDLLDRLHRYVRGPEGWAHVDVLAWDPTMLTNQKAFGMYTASSDDWLFIGAHMDDSFLRNGGSVSVYRRGPGHALEFVQRLAVSQEARFGQALAYDGTSLYVGAPLLMNDIRFQGGIVIHAFDGSRWYETDRLFIREPRTRGDGFGSSLKVEGNRMITVEDLRFSGTARGTMHLLRRDIDGSWHEDRRLIPNPPSPVSLGFGLRLALSQGRLLASSHDENAAYFFDLTCFDCKPDLDGDGALTIFDFLAFQTAFAEGCE